MGGDNNKPGNFKMVDLLKEVKHPVELSKSTTEVKESFDYHGLQDRDVSETFCRAIIECCRHTDINEPCRHTIFNEELVLTGCVAGVMSPLSHVTGLHEKSLVIVTEKEACLSNGHLNDQSSPFKPPFTCSIRTQATPTKSSTSHINKLVVTGVSTLAILRDNSARPLPIDKARSLISHYTTWCTAHSQNNLPELWVLCKGVRGVVALGCVVDPSKVVRVTKVTKSPSLSYPNSGASLKLDNYLPKMYSKVTKSSIGRSDKYSMSSLYEFGPSLEDGGDDEFLTGSLGGLRMHFVWDSLEPCLSAPPNTSAEAILSISVTPGYQVSPMLAVFHEIQRLLQFSKMTESAHVNWSEASEDVLNMPVSLVSKVETFLDELSSHMMRAIDVSILSPTAALSPFQPREDLDFLGQLWMFLKDASSPSDLVGALGVIFKAILLDQIQPFIHQNKQSNLATFCRRNMASSSSDEHQVIAMKLQSLLTEEKALKCLVEIGIEKMQRDYWSFFTTNELCTGSELERFFVRKGSLLSQCNMLCKLHCVIELTACLMSFLSLPKPSLSTFVKHCLQYYYHHTFEEFTATPTFNLPFAAFDSGLKCLANFAASLKPSALSVSFGSSADHHVLHCSVEPLFQYLSAPESPTEDKESIMYIYRASEQIIRL